MSSDKTISEEDNKILKAWLESHWQKTPVLSNDKETGEIIHVFAVQRGPVFPTSSGGTSGGTCFDVSFGLGPVTFRVEACFDISNISICLYVKIPFLSEYKLGCATGTLAGGVVIKFNWNIVSGTFTFHIKEKYLWLKYDVTILKTTYSGDIKLIPTPI